MLIPSPLLREVDFFFSVSHLLQQVFTLRKSQTLMTESTKRWQTNKRECSTHAKGMPRKTTICSFCQIKSQCKEVINITRTELRQEAPCPALKGQLVANFQLLVPNLLPWSRPNSCILSQRISISEPYEINGSGNLILFIAKMKLF